MRAGWQWFVAVLRWLAPKFARLIRVLCIVAVALGLGFAIADYADGDFMLRLMLYGGLPCAVGLIVADRLERFGNFVPEDGGPEEGPG